MATADENEQRIKELDAKLGFEKRLAEMENKVTELQKANLGNYLVILGDTLKIPLTASFAVSLFIALLFACVLVWIVAPKVSEKNFSLILARVFHVTNSEVVQDKTQSISAIYTLVTPHEQTLADLEKQKVNLSEDEKQWYKLDDGALEGFGRQLIQEGAQGFSRREVLGQGTHPLKHGWEWDITWSKHEITVERLVEIYEKWFHRNRDIYIEERHLGETRFAKKSAAQ
jgi:hypothetical protein